MTSITTPYLLDTNTYAEFFKPAIFRNPNFDRLKELVTDQLDPLPILSFYITEITSMEIHSAMGKEARGRNKSIELCTRKIVSEAADERICGNKWISNHSKKLSIDKLSLLLQQIDNAEKQVGSIHAHLLPMTSRAISEGKKLLRKYAYKHNLGSHDAFIAGFLIDANRAGKNLTLITFDTDFIKVLQKENLPIYRW
jgi:hypothetical protein